MYSLILCCSSVLRNNLGSRGIFTLCNLYITVRISTHFGSNFPSYVFFPIVSCFIFLSLLSYCLYLFLISLSCPHFHCQSVHTCTSRHPFYFITSSFVGERKNQGYNHPVWIRHQCHCWCLKPVSWFSTCSCLHFAWQVFSY